jgi:hypothetical protein
MTDTYTQLYEKFLTEQANDLDTNDDELIDDEAFDELIDDDDDIVDNIPRYERIQPKIRIIWFPNENSLPKITNESVKLAEYFKLRSNEVHYGDILYKIQQNGLEQTRLDLTKIISHWFPNKNAQWISLNCIGASNYCVSSLGDICHIHMRRLLKSGNEAYAAVRIKLDDNRKIRVALHNLIASAFWTFPKEPNMTVDHRDRSVRNNNKDNLSWETKTTQALNQQEYMRKSVHVIQINPNNKTIIKEWDSINEVAANFNVRYHVVNNAIRRQYIFNDCLWQFHEPLLEGEEFCPILIKGLEDVYVSNKGRFRLRNGHIVIGHLHSSGYRIVNLMNAFTDMKAYQAHILVAMMWISNDRPERNIVNHKDHVRHNNNVENLEWVTISENNKHANKIRRPVHYTDENGQCHLFPSISEASNITKISTATIIRACQKTKMGKVANFDYVDKYDIQISDGKSIPVVQCDLLTEDPLFVWKSLSCAALYTNITNANIIDVLIGKTTSAGGFFWRRTTIFEAPGDITTIDISPLKFKGTIRLIDSIVEIYESDNNLIINRYKSISEATRTLGIQREIITDIAKFRRNGHNNGDGLIRYFLFNTEYERRIKNNEPLITVVKAPDNTNDSIVIMSLEGNFIQECSAKDAALFVKENVTCKRNLGASDIIKVAKGHGHKIYIYRFVFARDYYTKPDSYKENLHVSVLREIKKTRQAN